MKKIYIILGIAAAFATKSLAQVNVTFQVDLSGLTVKTPKVAGTFGGLSATSKGVAIPDWDPTGSPVFTKVAGTANTWQAVITFPNPSKGQELLFKFLNTDNSWGACDVDQECFEGKAGDCNQGSGDFNRVYKIPTSAAVYGYKFNTCTKLVTRASDLALTDNINVYPNPSNNFVNIEFEDLSKKYNVELSTITGQTVKRFDNVDNRLTINDLESGIYFVKISDNEGKFQTQKLIIE